MSSPRTFREVSSATKHTAAPGSDLAYVCEIVCELKSGQAITVGRELLELVPSIFHNDTTFTPAHRVLGNIIGSAYTHSFRVSPKNGDVTFYRHADTGERRYSSPDDEVRRARILAHEKEQS